MSEDPSSDKDYSKRSKRRGGGNAGGPPNDYKQPGKKGPPKDYQVYYESKGYDKSSKEQSVPSKGNYNNSYDDYGSRPPRQDNYSSNYKPKPYQKQQQRRPGPEHGSNFWRKKATKISKDAILESSTRVAPHAELEEWLVDYRELFVKEIQAPVNDELNQLDPNDGLMAKATRAYKEEGESVPETQQSTAPSSNAKGFEMFDFGQERHDPIAAMRDRLRKDQNKDGAKIKKEEEELDGLLEDENDVKGLKNQSKYQTLEEELEENQGGDGHFDEELGGDGYSNIDEMFEKKLKNNEIPETYEDAFEELLGGAAEKRKEKLLQMEDDERPEWEELDTNKVIEDIKKEDFLSKLQQLPQDKRSLFGNKYVEEQEIQRPPTKGFTNANYLEEPKKQDNLFSKDFKDFDFDLSKLSFENDSELKSGIDDFPFKQEDLFPAFTKNVVPQQKPIGQEGLNPNFLTSMNFGPSFMQQGNIIRPTPQQLQQMQQMPPMHPGMPQNPQQMYPMHPPMNPMGQVGPMGPMGPVGSMGSMPPMNQMPPNQFGPGQGFMGNQLPPYKRDPTKEGGMPTPPPRFQPNPSFIFKYFSPNYDEKLWYYIDLQKRVQGPFSGKTMDEWYGNGHLPLTLSVTIGKNNGYKSLKELSDIIINTTLKGDMATPSPSETSKPAANQPGQAYSGISDLLKNRPEFAQYAPALETKGSAEKAKTLDEIEKSNSPQQYNQSQRGQNFTDYQSGRPEGYYHNPNPNYHHHGNQGHGGYYQHDYQRNVPKKYSGAGYGGDVDTVKPPSNSGTPNASTSPGISDGSQTASSGVSQQQTQPVSNGVPSANPLQSLVGGLGGSSNTSVDMTAQLKNMLGLGGAGGLGGLTGLGGLGGLNIGGGVSEPAQKPQTEKQPEKLQEKLPEKPLEKQQERPKQIERQQSGYQERPQYYYQQQEKPQQQQQQLQRKGSKAPKIDTSDFPSLTESYK